MTHPARRVGLGALAHRNYRLFFGGQVVSLTGTWMQSVAQGWLVLELTDSPFSVGLTAALGSLGVLVLTLYAGVVADRVDKRRAVIVTQSLQMVQAFVLAALALSGHATVGHVMVLAAFLGVIAAFDIPIRQSFIVELVGKDDLMNAIALNTSVFNATRILGPVAAGLIIGPLGVGVCFLLNGISYIAVIGGLLAMRVPPSAFPVPRSSVWSGLVEIARFIRGSRLVRTLIALTAVLSIFGFQLITLMPVFARDVLHVGATGYGLLMASLGVGAMAGAIGVAVLSRRIAKGRTMLAGGAAFGLLVALFGRSPSLGAALVLGGLAGLAMIVNNALTNTMIQTAVPDGLRGRVMGLYSFVFVGMAPVGAFQAGWVAEHWGAPIALGIGGLVCAAAVAEAGWRVGELREVR
jgi:MFS family permease